MTAHTENLLQRARNWLRTRWAKSTVLVLIAVLVLGTLAPYFLNADRYRATISGLIAAETGRQVRLGKIRMQFLPRVGFTVEDAHMGNPADFAPGDFVSAQQVRGGLAFWPLVLRHEFLLTSLDLAKPRLTLLEDAHGRTNYTFAPVPPPASTAAMAANLTQALPRVDNTTLEIDRVILHDAEVVYGRMDELGQVTVTMDATGFSAELRHLTLQPFALHEWQGEAKLSGVHLALLNWSGPISFAGGSVKLRGGALEADFTVNVGQAARVDGTATVADVEHPVMRFDLKTPDLDLDALVAGHPKLFGESGQDREIPPAMLFAATDNQPPSVGELLAVGHLSAEKIRSKPYAAGPLTVDVRLYTDRAEIWPFTLRLEGGSLQATARTDQRQRPRRFSVNLEARNIDVARALAPWPALRGKLAGTAELDMQVFGSLEAFWAQSLEAKGQFAIRNGRVAGFNLAGAAQSLASLAGVNGDTTFTAITGDVDVVRASVSSRDIHLNSPRGIMDVRGVSGFDGSLRYDGQVTADLSTTTAGTKAPSGVPGADPVSSAIKLLAKNIGKVTVPISVRGTIQHPEVRPGQGLLSFPAQGATKPQDGASFPNLFGK